MQHGRRPWRESAPVRFGTTHSNGSATRTRALRGPIAIAAAGRSQRAAVVTHRRARTAATSAVSAGCTTLPAAKTPSTVVRPVGVTGGTPRARIDQRGRPGGPARCPGRSRRVKTTVSTATARSSPSGPRSSTRSTRSLSVRCRPPTVCVQSGTRRPDRVAASKARKVCGRREIGDERHRVDAGLAQGEDRRVGHVLGPDDQRPRAHRQVLAVHPLLELAGREDPGGRVPGTRRAARGRSRAPVASTTARAWTSSRPLRSRDLGPAGRRPPRHHGAGPDVDAGRDGPLHPPTGVGRAAQHPAQITQSEARVRTEAWRPARLVLPLEDQDAFPRRRP